jgi:hypothetical protein
MRPLDRTALFIAPLALAALAAGLGLAPGSGGSSAVTAGASNTASACGRRITRGGGPISASCCWRRQP